MMLAPGILAPPGMPTHPGMPGAPQGHGAAAVAGPVHPLHAPGQLHVAALQAALWSTLQANLLCLLWALTYLLASQLTLLSLRTLLTLPTLPALPALPALLTLPALLILPALLTLHHSTHSPYSTNLRRAPTKSTSEVKV